MTEYFETCSKKGRGRAKKSLELIDAMYAIAEAANPITGRGVGYKLFTQKLILSMSTADMSKVYRLLKEAREEGIIPWPWIVDETRELEEVSTWSNPAAFVSTVRRAYRRDFWQRQPVRVQVWSEKGTVRGVLKPTLDEYGVGFQAVHGFSSATAVKNIAGDNDGRDLIVLYVGDYDPSGMCMSEKDLPQRLENYGGDHVVIERVALTRADCAGLPSFSASEKRKDPRYNWFVENFGKKCWELDAMDPNVLPAKVERAIRNNIEWEQWERDVRINEAEKESLQTVLNGWAGDDGS